VQPVPKEQPVRKDFKATKVHKDSKGIKVQPAAGQQVRKAPLARQAHRARRAKVAADLAAKVPKVIQDPKVTPAFRVPRALKE
jgi:hypothetical protein